MKSQIHQTEAELKIAGVTTVVTLDARYQLLAHDDDNGYEVEILSVRAPVVAIKGDSISMDWMLNEDVMRAIEDEIRGNV